MSVQSCKFAVHCSSEVEDESLRAPDPCHLNENTTNPCQCDLYDKKVPSINEFLNGLLFINNLAGFS